MNKEKSENIQNNKLKLFIDKAKSDKVAIWMIVTIFSITLFFTLIDKSYANKSRDIFDLLSAPLASSLTTYVFYRIFIFLIFEPYLAILNKKKYSYNRHYLDFYCVYILDEFLHDNRTRKIY